MLSRRCKGRIDGELIFRNNENMKWWWVVLIAAGVAIAMWFVQHQKKESKRLRWVALGDSLTVGYGAAPEESYPERMVRLSYEAGVPLKLVKNLANGGHTLAKVQLMQLPLESLYHPDLVTLWVGTNDALLYDVTGKDKDILSREPLPTSPENFERRLNELLEKLARRGVSHVFIGKLHDLSRIPAAEGFQEERKDAIQNLVRSYNEIFERAAQKYPEVTLVPLDQISDLTDPQQYLQDGVHPRPQAYRAVAEAWWQAMRERLTQ